MMMISTIIITTLPMETQAPIGKIDSYKGSIDGQGATDGQTHPLIESWLTAKKNIIDINYVKSKSNFIEINYLRSESNCDFVAPPPRYENLSFHSIDLGDPECSNQAG